MATAFQWIELVLTHKAAALSLLALLLGGNGWQWWDRGSKATQIKNTEAAVTHLAENVNRSTVHNVVIRQGDTEHLERRLRRLEGYH